MREFTVMNGRSIPIQSGDAITITFLPRSPYPGDEGVWTFWTLFKGSNGVTGRWRGDDPGERFRQMEGHPEYVGA